MAAIIAQMTLAARRRKEKGKGYLSGDKSNYILKRFDPVFEAKKHNLFRLKRQHYEYKREIKAKAKGKFATFCQYFHLLFVSNYLFFISENSTNGILKDIYWLINKIARKRRRHVIIA